METDETDNATADEIMSAARTKLTDRGDALSMLTNCSLAPGTAGGLELFAPGGAVYNAVSRTDSLVMRAVAEAAEDRGIPASQVRVRLY